jgi:hypothetical protein
VGENKAIGRLVNSLYWSAFITGKCMEAIENKEEIWITIKQ